MVFRLLDHLDTLDVICRTNSQVTARCPICSAKLVIKVPTSAYKCVAECTSDEIREKLGFPKSGKYISKVDAPLVPIRLSSKIELFKTVEKVVIPDSTYISAKHEQKVRRREFQYTPTHKMVRIDLLVDKKKVFYSLVLDDGKWIQDTPETSSLYLPVTFEPDNKFLTFVEGEKCVVDLCNIGIMSVTTASFAWGQERLTQAIAQFHRKISGIIYIPDNDKTGVTKAIGVQNICWRIGIPCKILSLKNYYTEPKEDVSDLIHKGLDVTSIIQRLI